MIEQIISCNFIHNNQKSNLENKIFENLDHSNNFKKLKNVLNKEQIKLKKRIGDDEPKKKIIIQIIKVDNITIKIWDTKIHIPISFIFERDFIFFFFFFCKY